MKKIVLTIGVALLFSINALALPKEVKIDMLKTEFVQQLKNKEYSKSLQTIQELKNMKVKLPESFDYFEAKATYESGDKAGSYKLFEKYVNENGKKGKYYKQTIMYLIEAESAYNAIVKKQRERIEREKQEKLAREKAEKERIAREKAERERIAYEKDEKERIAREKAERERVKKEKLIKAAKDYISQKVYDKHGNQYQTVKSPYTGKIWLDRNLGAKRLCQSYNDTQCYGDYFRFGKDNCPKGFRVPSIEELEEETVNQKVKNRNDAFQNFLRLPSAGSLTRIIGGQKGNAGFIWSSSRPKGGGMNAKIYDVALQFESHSAHRSLQYHNKSPLFSVRCIQY